VIGPDVPMLPKWLESPTYVPVIVALPGATPVKDTVQLPADNVQLAPTVPTPVFDEVKLTDPVGVLEVMLRSVTLTVQVID